MKTQLLRISIVILVAGLFVFGVLMPGELVQASTGQTDPTATPGPWQSTRQSVRETLAALPTPDNSLLENLLVREQLALSNQEVRISLAHQAAGATSKYIESEKASGQDTAALEAALATFNQELVQVESDHAGAAGILASPAGFDADGKVTDREQARQTVRSAGTSLRKAHLTLTSASLDLRLAVKEYRTN